MEYILNRIVPLEIYGHSKSLFDVITKCSQTQDRRFIFDLQAVRDAYKTHKVSNVSFIRGPKNQADGMSKPLKCFPLQNLLLTGEIDFIVYQWVIRNAISNPK